MNFRLYTLLRISEQFTLGKYVSIVNIFWEPKNIIYAFIKRHKIIPLIKHQDGCKYNI